MPPRTSAGAVNRSFSPPGNVASHICPGSTFAGSITVTRRDAGAGVGLGCVAGGAAATAAAWPKGAAAGAGAIGGLGETAGAGAGLVGGGSNAPEGEVWAVGTMAAVVGAKWGPFGAVAEPCAACGVEVALAAAGFGAAGLGAAGFAARLAVVAAAPPLEASPFNLLAEAPPSPGLPCGGPTPPSATAPPAPSEEERLAAGSGAAAFDNLRREDVCSFFRMPSTSQQ